MNQCQLKVGQRLAGTAAFVNTRSSLAPVSLETA
jgi:hypothetical protein